MGFMKADEEAMINQAQAWDNMDQHILSFIRETTQFWEEVYIKSFSSYPERLTYSLTVSTGTSLESTE